MVRVHSTRQTESISVALDYLPWKQEVAGSSPVSPTNYKKIKVMANVEKKRKKLKEKISELEAELRNALTKKTSTTKEINVASHTLRIQTLQKELEKL